MNKLQELTSVDYSGMETASMVVAVLKETLGLTDTQLARILRHFVYDGVYSSKEERINGGGCLDITKNVSQLLGLSNEISGK